MANWLSKAKNRAGNPVYAVAYPKVAHTGSYEFTGSLTQ